MRFERTWVRRDKSGFIIDLNSSRNLVKEFSLLSVGLEWLLGG